MKGKGSVKDDSQVPVLGNELVGDHIPKHLNLCAIVCSVSSLLQFHHLLNGDVN